MPIRPQFGSDLVVDLMRAAGIEYVAINPGATFRGVHDSLVNYAGNKEPEHILTNHEEIAVGIAHGYAKAKGRPMAAIVHDIVGLQHASLARRPHRAAGPGLSLSRRRAPGANDRSSGRGARLLTLRAVGGAARRSARDRGCGAAARRRAVSRDHHRIARTPSRGVGDPLS